MSTSSGISSSLASLGEVIISELEEAHRAREKGLTACRRTIRASSLAIRAVHRGLTEEYQSRIDEADGALREAQKELLPYPQVAHAGFLHDAEKEYVEARLTVCLVEGEELKSYVQLGVGIAAWLNGLAEAASELRRYILDRLRMGELNLTEVLLRRMEDCYEFLVSIEYPDALTGGLRRTTDSLRAVLERTRGDVTTTLLQGRLQHLLEESIGRSC
ncbi:MAG: haloacid dehalogenase [Actinobacteria bacterium]|nr:haloacid dehalogenase [Actinomycetota bacterium]MCL6095388.1 haloacid dehalogenase [Actinomycetota bacterium]